MLSPNFPAPLVPKYPVLGWSSFSRAAPGGRPSVPPTLLSLPHKAFVTSARVAIALALKRLGVKPGDEVLVPAYHCLSMVEPVDFCGAVPRFFPLTPRLEVPIDVLDTLDLSKVRAMLVTHYFGFPQPMQAIDAFARSRGIPVIEDCAHAIYGSVDGRLIGAWGDYAAVSLMKFFPVYDGGCLVSATHALDDLVLQAPSSRFEAKALINAVERGLSYRRFPGLQTAARTALSVKDAMWRGFKQVKRAARGSGPAFEYHDPAASEGNNGLDPSWLDRRISRASRQLVDHLPVDRIVAQRRRNYRRFAEAFDRLPDAEPLLPDLPADVVPYAFPLAVRRPDRVFRRIKLDAVPLFRWERLWNEGAAAVDPQASRYAQELFQFPCHQDMTDDDVSWMIERVRDAFAAAA